MNSAEKRINDERISRGEIFANIALPSSITLVRSPKYISGEHQMESLPIIS